MINNDVLRSLRYSLKINDTEMLKVFREADYEVVLADLQAWLLPEEDEAQVLARRCVAGVCRMDERLPAMAGR